MQTEEPITEAIVIHPYLYHKFMKQGKNFHNLIALYLFYLHNAQLQKTNQILATDGFVHNGLGWGLEKIKKIKAVLKKLGVIEMVRTGYYSYIKLVYIYSKKKIAEVLESKEVKKEEKAEKTPFQVDLENNGIEAKKAEDIRGRFVKIIKEKEIKNVQSLAISKWVIYCENNNITYNKKNIEKWLNTLNNAVIVEQFQLVNRAINKEWKSIYPISLKESKYQKFLGRSIKYKDKLYQELENIFIQDKKIFYIFKENKQISTPINDIPIDEIFKKYEFIEDGNRKRDLANMLGACFQRID